MELKTHQERMLKLRIIRTKKDAETFAKDCETGDWSHTFGMNPGNNIDEAWENRKDINNFLRKYTP